MACALSPNFPALLVFRLLCGLNAASPNAVLGGLYADILDNPQTRGIAMALFMVVTGFGPQLAPLVSGFVSTVSWRWTFWVGLAAAGVGYPFILFIPETYVPVLKKRHARRLAKAGKLEQNGCNTIQPQGPGHRGDGILSIFMRPFVMIAKEPVLLFASLFMGFTYAMFYLYFQAYPIIFQSKTSISGRVIGPLTELLGRSIWAITGRSRARILTKYVNSIAFCCGD
jgi:MFS family permease